MRTLRSRNGRSRSLRLGAVTVLATAVIGAVSAGQASAVANATTGIATVTQSPSVSTPGFNTPCVRSNKPQNCAALRAFAETGTTMFTGGSFAQVLNPSGQPYVDPGTGQPLTGINNLVALDTSNGNSIITAFHHTFNGPVLSLAVTPDDSRLYAGGTFTKVDGVQQLHLVAFDLTAGNYGAIVKAFLPAGATALTRNPGIKNASYAARGVVRSLAIGPVLPAESGGTTGGTGPSGTLYVGGDFTGAEGADVQQLTAIDISSGALEPGFAPNIAVATDPLPYCGNFQPVLPTKNWTQIVTLTLGPDANGSPRLYVGGHFDTVDGNAQTALTAVDPVTGRWDSTFKPVPDWQKTAANAVDGGKVEPCYDILHTGNQVLPVDSASGTRGASVLLAQAGHYNRTYRFNLDGSRVWNVQPGGDSQSVAIVGKTVYVGGHFICWSTDTKVGLGRSDCLAAAKPGVVPPAYEIQRVHLAAVQYDTGATDMSWDPLAQPSTYSPYYFGVWAVHIDRLGQLWAGGVYRTVTTPDGTTVNRLKLAVFPVLAAGAAPTVTMTPTICRINKPCTFSAWADPSPGSTIVSYSWDFGDGTTAPAGSSSTISHVYTVAGYYSPTVTVTDNNGLTGIGSPGLTTF
jgi:hypothetical protein